MLGKRKREAVVVSRSTEQEEVPVDPPVDSHDLLRKYFEARFEPLEELQKTQASTGNISDLQSEDESADSEWDGISDEDEDSDAQASRWTPEVIDYSMSNELTKDELEKELRKQFMVSVHVPASYSYQSPI